MNPQLGQFSLSYNLIILRVDEGKLDPIRMGDLVQYFSEVFCLAHEPAEQILRSAPIVLLAGIPKDTLKKLKDHLVKLSKMGIEFMLSTRLSPTIPRVVWPNKQPDYTEYSGGLIKYVDFQWRGNAFVCPNCAETFVFRRVGNPLARYIQVKEEVGGAGTKSSIIPPPEPQPQAQPVEPAVDETDVVELQPLAPEEVVELAPVEEAESAQGDLEPIDILGGSEEPADQSAEDSLPAEEAPVYSEQDSGATEQEGGGGEEQPQNDATSLIWSVFLTAIPPAKKKDAAGLIAQIKGIPLQQAMILTSRLLVPIVKDKSKEEATQCLEEFQKIGVKGRLTARR
ncbi:MAG: hypothetical protein QME51_03635 [Planctomycetota bacterium]|nr:hypothetical protein [Planctomycetota bacterium]MDI6787441.1 hypothetical protein [Planctomycetota bacterium]